MTHEDAVVGFFVETFDAASNKPRGNKEVLENPSPAGALGDEAAYDRPNDGVEWRAEREDGRETALLGTEVVGDDAAAEGDAARAANAS